jgi:chorismate mutase/prephenate dehydrogenase
MDLAAEVGRVKAERGAPIVVRDVEDRILSRARQHARACGVSEDVMEAIFQAIVRGSVERQHRVGVAARAARGGRVLVVGGAGEMGSWFCRFLELVGHSVEAADTVWRSPIRTPGHHAALGDVADLDVFDFVLVAVPLASTPTVLEEVVARRPRGVVVEIASIKEHLSAALVEADRRQVRVSALHPMFGPAKSLYEPLIFVLACRVDASEERRRVEQLLLHPYSSVVTIPFPHHDRLMGWLLGLAHLTSMLFGAALTRSGLDHEELEACASTTFRRQAATALSVLSESSDLYLDIQRLNPHRKDIVRAAREALAELVELIEGNDRERFRDTLLRARHAVAGEI